MEATVVMLGPPGSGKGTQAARLRDGLGYEVLSTGELRIVFDGFPRTVAQARALDRALAGRGRRVDAAVLIDIPDDEVVRRILSRHQGRSDDTPGIAHERLRAYHDQTEPLVAYFEEPALLRRVDGARDVASVEHEVRDALA